MNNTITLTAAIAAMTIGHSANAQDFSFFLAEDGLSNPANINSAAVDPARVNPDLVVNGVDAQRLYIWALFNDVDENCRGLSFNVQTNGGATITDLQLYNIPAPVVGTAWDGFVNGSANGSDRWDGASANSILQPGLFTGDMNILLFEHPHVIDVIQLVGHIEVVGAGDIFLEVGTKGIIRDGFETLPGPQVALGFGDAPVSGSAYSTASTVADATLTEFVCVGDLNGDNTVDTADLGGLLGSFGTAGPFGDINGDGTVDTADLGILLANFGLSCAP